jgi:hypothetical protein
MKLALVTLLTLVATGCAAASGSTEDTGASSDEALSGGIDIPNPSGAYFASVTANGTGCPAGTWSASISSDGQQFTVEFFDYEAMINPGQSVAIKDCTLGIDLRSPTGLSFAVGSFLYQGYAMLDSAGMTARQTAKYYFTGNPVPAETNYSDMRGPYDDSFLFQDEILVADLAWSPCGTARRLNAQTRLVLQNNPTKSGSGYINTSTVDAEIAMLFRWNLSWRSCGSSGKP